MTKEREKVLDLDDHSVVTAQNSVLFGVGIEQTVIVGKKEQPYILKQGLTDDEAEKLAREKAKELRIPLIKGIGTFLAYKSVETYRNTYKEKHNHEWFVVWGKTDDGLKLNIEKARNYLFCLSQWNIFKKRSRTGFR